MPTVIVKAIFSEGSLKLRALESIFSVNGFTENVEAIFYFQSSVHSNYEH